MAAQIHPLFLEAFNTGDVEGIVNLYEPNATLVIGREQLVGRDAIRAAYTRLFKQSPRMTMRTRAVIESAEGLAVLHGEWNLEPGGGQGLSTEVVRRQPDGSWRFVIDNPRTPA
jgi:uncharacterized protein (TIGR02246 family)